jgi:hypothetical protein
MTQEISKALLKQEKQTAYLKIKASETAYKTMREIFKDIIK